MIERLLVVIPALDAEATLSPVVSACMTTVQQLTEGVLEGISIAQARVVVVDDGSTDGTAQVAERQGATVLRHRQNRGKGAALKTGFAHALGKEFDAVLTLDADGQHTPSEIPRFIRTANDEEADLVIGSRKHLFGGMVPRRRNANRFSAWAISWAAGIRIEDSQSGFRLYSTRLLRAVKIRATGFDAESEVLVRAGRAGFRTVSIPIGLDFVDGVATSHYKPVQDTLRIIRTVARTRFVS